MRGGLERRWLNSRGHKMNTQLDYAQKRKSLITSYRIPAFRWLDGWYTFAASAYDEQTDYIDLRNIKLIASRSGQINEFWTATASMNALRERWGYASGTEFTNAVYQYSTLVYPQIAADYVNVDDRLFPRSGISGSATVRGGVEGAGSDTSFVQANLAVRWYVPLGESNRLILRGEGGTTWTSDLVAMPPNATDMFVIVKPPAEWPDPGLGKAALIERLETKLGQFPGNAYEITQPIQMRFNELIAGVRGDIAVKVFGDDFVAMNRTAEQIASVLRRTEGAVDVKVEQTTGLPMLDIRVNRDAMARVGVTAQDVQDTITATLGGRTSGMIFEGDRRFPVVIRLSDTERADLRRLEQVQVPVAGGSYVPLSSVADIGVVDGPNQISRENGKRRVVVQANVRGRDVGSVVADAQEAVASGVRLPAGTYLEWGAQFENLEAASQRLKLVVPACFVLILLLLYGALGSVRDAAIVFTGVPFALVGGVLLLFVRGMDFSISAAVGFIALSGIAVLNGLVMVSSVQDLIRSGMDRAEAARTGAIQRLRPVVMTALVASLGFVPMAFASGAGAEVQKPLATVVIGGLISATLLTLFVLPTLYARFGQRSVEATGETSHHHTREGAA